MHQLLELELNGADLVSLRDRVRRRPVTNKKKIFVAGRQLLETNGYADAAPRCRIAASTSARRSIWNIPFWLAKETNISEIDNKGLSTY